MGISGGTVHKYTCPLCECMCGLDVKVEDERVTLIRGNRDDVWSKGYLCPKGAPWATSTTIPTG